MTELQRHAMPDLSGHSRQTLTLILSYVFTGAGPTTPQSRMLAISFVRTLDRAVDDYNHARELLDEFITTPPNRISPLLRATGHIESCVNALHRCLVFAHKLRSHGLRYPDGRPVVPRPTEATALSKATQGRVRAVRNAIEHLDGDIAEGRLAPGDPIAVLLHEEDFELKGQCIRYAELADWIEQLRLIADGLIHYRNGVNTPASTTPPADTSPT